MLFYPMAVAVCALSGVGDTVLLDFQADWCGPCRSMQPTVQRLEAAGYPVRQVNIDREPDLAQQYGVSSIPCFVAVVGGRERGRQVGASGYDQLKQMLDSAGMGAQAAEARRQVTGARDQSQARSEPMIARGQSPPEGGLMRRIGLGKRAEPMPPANNPGAMTGGGPLAPPVVEMPSMPSAPPSPAPAAAPLGPQTFANEQSAPPAAKSGLVPLTPREQAPAALSNQAPPLERMPFPNAAAAPQNLARDTNQAFPAKADSPMDGPLETKLLKASVRIRVEGSADVAVGSGTIIDQRQDPNGSGGEALVLTCAHIFRESQGKAPIRVERFDQQMPQSVAARMLRYDLDRDVALITFRVDTPATVARLAPQATKTQQADPVISIGCDNGQPPSAHRSRVIAINKIQGAPNLQVAGQPAVGRSGGGLFDVQGRLIGICNFADPQDQAGLFADVISGHELLAQAGLAEISKAAGLAAADTSGQPASPPPMPESMPRGLTTPANSPATELICVVRTGSGAASRNETIIISNASPDLVNRLVAEQRGAQAAIATSLEVPRAPQAPAPTNNWQPQWK